MTGLRSPRLRAILQALLVTTLWSTSWVLVKIGLEDIPAVTFAGLRYFLAFLILIPVFLLSKKATPLRSLSRSNWLSMAVMSSPVPVLSREARQARRALLEPFVENTRDFEDFDSYKNLWIRPILSTT